MLVGERIPADRTDNLESGSLTRRISSTVLSASSHSINPIAYTQLSPLYTLPSIQHAAGRARDCAGAPGVPRASFVDAFPSTPGTPSALTGHVFPTVNRIRRTMKGEGSNNEPLTKLMVANRGVSTYSG